MRGIWFVLWLSKVLLASETTYLPYLCSKQGHQAIVIDDAMYFFGGHQAFNQSSNNETDPIPNPDFARSFFRVNISRDWNKQVDSWQYDILSPSNSTETPPESILGAGLYRDPIDPDVISLYGGAPLLPEDVNNTLDLVSKVPDEFWSFNKMNLTWSKRNVADGHTLPLMVSRHGSYAQALEYQLGFYLDASGLSVINQSSGAVYPTSTMEFSISESQISGHLHYIPSVGSKGALVLFGGASISGNRTRGNITRDLVPMDTVRILDVATLDTGDGTWYAQNTSGRTPDARIDSCSVMVAAPDNSSYNIYMYGGRSVGRGYDEMWVLSIPQFRWTKVVKGSSPNFGPVCVLIGSKQMVVAGGIRYGRTCNMAKQFTIFDLTSLQWADNYIVPDPPYQVPRALVEWIGGSVHGNATMTRPDPDFSSEGLAALFGKTLLSDGNGELPVGGSSRLSSQLSLLYILLVVITMSYALM